MENNHIPEEIMTFFKSLASPDRLKIAGLIAIQDMTPVQLAERTGLKPVSVLNHLDQLVHARLAVEKMTSAEQRSSGQPAVYALDTGYLNELSRRVLSGSRPRVQLEEFDGVDYDRKVLGDFLRPDGTLKSIPSQHKKLLAVLHYLVKEFEPGRKYAEKQVNISLARFYPDAASLRRYLVDNAFLAREAGFYWRLEQEN